MHPGVVGRTTATPTAAINPWRVPPLLPSQALDVVQADLDALSGCCEAMGASLAGSRAAAADLLHDSERLQRALQVGWGCRGGGEAHAHGQLVSEGLRSRRLLSATPFPLPA